MGEFLERGVSYDRLYMAYNVGGTFGYHFKCREFANIFAYLAAQYGATNAEPIMKKIENKFKVSSLAFDIVSSAGKDVIALVINVGPLVGGDAYMKSQASNSAVFYNLYDPMRDTNEYIQFLILSWCYSPGRQPLYKAIPPGSLGKPH